MPQDNRLAASATPEVGQRHVLGPCRWAPRQPPWFFWVAGGGSPLTGLVSGV